MNSEEEKKNDLPPWRKRIPQQLDKGEERKMPINNNQQEQQSPREVRHNVGMLEEN